METFVVAVKHEIIYKEKMPVKTHGSWIFKNRGWQKRWKAWLKKNKRVEGLVEKGGKVCWNCPQIFKVIHITIHRKTASYPQILRKKIRVETFVGKI